MNNPQQQATSILAEALMISSSRVTTETTLGVTPEWDSLAHMRLVVTLEEHLGAQLSLDEIVSISRLHDVIAILE